ncbi:MAG: F0F1 ATP synthase subunit gamma [Azospirillaceae bacterium]|nr:F0F1 ATP synthase subunit gamma [Azospirillaceae bacterium]
MPSLKDLKLRISSVKSTQKITAAMKMVAASKLRRAQEQAEAGRPYAERMARILASLTANVQAESVSSPLLAGTGKDAVHLLLIVTSDRGLCGGFNGTVVREARRQIDRLQREGKTVKLLVVGRKGRDQMRRTHAALIIDSFEEVGRRRLSFADATAIADRVLALFGDQAFDVAALVYNKFKSAISQIITVQQIIPFAMTAPADAPAEGAEARAIYEFEPDEEQLLADLLPKNLAVQIYRALLESAASEQGARMTAMDNATRNAGDMIQHLTLRYNRTRQSVITNELIEIISGAEAL